MVAKNIWWSISGKLFILRWCQSVWGRMSKMWPILWIWSNYPQIIYSALCRKRWGYSAYSGQRVCRKRTWYLCYTGTHPILLRSQWKNPWNYIWIQFDGFKIKEMLNHCGLSETNPVLPARTCHKNRTLSAGYSYKSRGWIRQIIMYINYFSTWFRQQILIKRRKKKTERCWLISKTPSVLSDKNIQTQSVFRTLRIIAGLNRSGLTRYLSTPPVIHHRNISRSSHQPSKNNCWKKLMSIQRYCLNAFGYTTLLLFPNFLRDRPDFSPSDYRDFSHQKTPITEHTCIPCREQNNSYRRNNRSHKAHLYGETNS